jgi:hypothetical protein
VSPSLDDLEETDDHEVVEFADIAEAIHLGLEVEDCDSIDY